jgi:hypothetical protein
MTQTNAIPRHLPKPQPFLKPPSPKSRARVIRGMKRYRFWRVAKRPVILAAIGLILMALTYAKFHRLSPKMNPMDVVDKERNVQHGIPPKPPYIIPAPLQVPAWQRHLPPLYPRYPQKLPKKVGGGNYQLL